MKQQSIATANDGLDSVRSHGQWHIAWEHVATVLLLIFAAIFYIRTAFTLGLGPNDGGPDESMRALIPRCIINGNPLPSGYDACSIYSVGNWSYAFYPQMLAGYISALFMSVAQAFGATASVTFMTGRLTSVVFGLIALVSVSRTIAVIFSGKRYTAVLEFAAIALLGFWPQFAFLSSYMNNDIVALAGVSVLVHALVSGMKTKWRLGNSIELAAGITLCGLGYWNSYGFILVAVILFIMSAWMQNLYRRKRAMQLIAIAAVISAVLVLPWFIVNIVRYHDLVGMSTFREEYYQWLQDGGEVLQHPYTSGMRMLFLKTDFVKDTAESFVGRLGYMSIITPFVFTFIYYILSGVGAGLFLAQLKLRWQSKNFRMLVVGVAVACLITLALFMYYTTHTDYQPQGRYIIYLLVPLVIASVTGIGDAAELKKPIPIAIFVFALALYIYMCIFIFQIAATEHGWNGVQWVGAL